MSHAAATLAPKHWAGRAVVALTIAIHKQPISWLVFSILLTIAAGFTASTLVLKSKLEDLLPASAPSVVAMQTLRERLGSADRLVVTIMTDDFERVKPVLPLISAELQKHPDIVTVQWRQDLALIEKNAMVIFPTLPQLVTYQEDLTEAIKVKVRKRLDLFGDDDEVAEGVPGEEGKPPTPAVRTTYAWGELEQDDALSRIGRRFRSERTKFREHFYNAAYTTIGLQAFPSKPSSDLNFSKQLLEDVERTVSAVVKRELGEVGEDKLVKRIDYGGSYRSAVEESKSIKRDLFGSSGAALALLALILVAAFRSVRVFFCVMLPLVMGTVWTAGLVALTVGYLNLITAFIFAVLLGLGIDFGIHYYGRFREERAAGNSPLDAMIITQVSSGQAVLNAQLTTSLAFFALALADFRGFSQFGLVAGAGVMLCHLAVVLVLPAVAFTYERFRPLELKGFTVARDTETGDIKRGRFGIAGRIGLPLVLLCLGALFVAPRYIDFEYDFRNLSAKPKEGGPASYEKVQYGTTTATAPAVIFARSEDEARGYYEQLQAKIDEADGEHPRIKSYQSLFSLVPTQQDEKREVVSQICRKLKRKVGLFEGDAKDGANELLSHCDPGPITIADLPDWVTSQFTDKTGKVGEFIYVSPRGSMNDGQVALAFREEMLTLKSPTGEPAVVSGKPMVWAEVLMQMRIDGQVITIAALVAVLLVLIWFERSYKPVLLVLLPLVTAFGIVAAAMAVLDIKLNFYNMLAAPTLIGLGVDGGTHLYHRYKELGPGSIPYILRNTGWSSFLVALTSSMGYFSLVNAGHRGLNSLGVLTLICIGANLFTTFVLLPAVLQWGEDRAARRVARAR